MKNPIEMIDASLLRSAVPERSEEELQEWVEPIKKACREFEINTVRRVAAFISQMAHECRGFTKFEESMWYRAKRLMEVWPHRFPTHGLAARYARNPEKLANNVYANRMGNGSEASGDGWFFRGGGGLHVTGRYNWQGFADSMGMELKAAVEYGRSTTEGKIMSAAWFWEENDVNRLADTPSVNDETRKINGGYNGLADRKRRFDKMVSEMLRRGA